MSNQDQFISVPTLGPRRFDSPLRRSHVPGDGLGRFIPDDLFVRHEIYVWQGQPAGSELLFEKAGAREKIFFAMPLQESQLCSGDWMDR